MAFLGIRWDDWTTYAFAGIAIGLGFGVFTYWTHFDSHTCGDPVDRPVNEPEFAPGEVRLGRTYRPPEVREMVVFRHPRQDVRIGRVVARAGETVELPLAGSERGELKVNDALVDEKGIRYHTSSLDVPKVLVPRDCVFVLVDKRSTAGGDQVDSRAYGPIHLGSISHVIPPKPVKEGR